LTFNNDGEDWAACAQDPGMSGRTEITLFKGSDTSTARTSFTSTISGSGDVSAGTTGVASGTSSPAYSIVDLTAAYSRQNSSRVARGFAFTASYEHLIIVDEFEFASGSAIHNVTWAMHTMATIKLAAGTVLVFSTVFFGLSRSMLFVY
jgi:hypothetical protein